MMGNFSRITRTQRGACWLNMLGIFASGTLATIVGLLAALALGSSDPTEWMVPLGGITLGVLALVFVACATLLPWWRRFRLGRRRETHRVGALGAGLFLPAAVGAFFPALIYDSYFKPLVWVSLALAPLYAFYLVDFLLLRHRRLNLRSFYEGRFSSRYGFWRGFNPASVIAVAVASLTYYLLLNPLSYEQAYVFRFVSASIPAFFGAALAHVLLMKLLVQSLGKGGYETATEKEAAKDTEAEEVERCRHPR